MTVSADKLVSTYIKIRDAKDTLVREHEQALKSLTEQMEIIERNEKPVKHEPRR